MAETPDDDIDVCTHISQEAHKHALETIKAMVVLHCTRHQELPTLKVAVSVLFGVMDAWLISMHGIFLSRATITTVLQAGVNTYWGEQEEAKHEDTGKTN